MYWEKRRGGGKTGIRNNVWTEIYNLKCRRRKPEMNTTFELKELVFEVENFSFQKQFLLPVLGPPFWISDVDRCRAMSSVPYLSRASSKTWGSSTSFRSKVISASIFHMSIFRSRIKTTLFCWSSIASHVIPHRLWFGNACARWPCMYVSSHLST